MSDIGEYIIISFENNISELKEILEITLSIIFFHRNLSNEKFEDGKGILTNISYVKINNEKLSKEITNILNELETNFKEENKLYGYQITLNFFEKLEKNKSSEKPWETWNLISILVKKEDLKEKNEINEENSNSSYLDKENNLRENIFKIIDKLNDKGNYMPKINIDDKNSEEETFIHNFIIYKIYSKEEYLSKFDNYVKKNQENVIIINQSS